MGCRECPDLDNCWSYSYASDTCSITGYLFYCINDFESRDMLKESEEVFAIHTANIGYGFVDYIEENIKKRGMSLDRIIKLSREDKKIIHELMLWEVDHSYIYRAKNTIGKISWLKHLKVGEISVNELFYFYTEYLDFFIRHKEEYEGNQERRKESEKLLSLLKELMEMMKGYMPQLEYNEKGFLC